MVISKIQLIVSKLKAPTLPLAFCFWKIASDTQLVKSLIEINLKPGFILPLIQSVAMQFCISPFGLYNIKTLKI